MKNAKNTTEPHTELEVPDSRPVWTPLETLPFNLDEQDTTSLVGALQAVLEHQQVVTLRADTSSMSGRMRSMFAHPGLVVNDALQQAHHHEMRARRYGGSGHAPLTDAIVARLPPELPNFVSKSNRYKAHRAYRIMRKHLYDTYGLYKVQRDLWKARNKIEDDDDVDVLEEAS